MLIVPPKTYIQMPDAVAQICAAQRIVMACHVNPDGDTLGSLLALGLALREQGKDVTLLSSDPIPPTLKFLPGVETVKNTTKDEMALDAISSERDGFDLAIALDSGDLPRLGKNQATILSAPCVLDIDHHVTPGAFGQIRLLDATAAATAEIVFDLLGALNVELTPATAQCLLCGLLTDTGSFRYKNVTPRTMAIAGQLIACGADPDTIVENVYENRSFAAQKLLGRALESLQVSDDGRIVWAYVTAQDFAELNAVDQETEGIIGAVRMVRGSEIAVLFREMPTGKIRVSLRAKPPQDVARVATRFNGGGHRLASGCTLDGPLPQAIDALLAAITADLVDACPPE